MNKKADAERRQPTLQEQTLKTYGDNCIWCNHKLIPTKEYRALSSQEKSRVRIATVDHILPKSCGGTDHIKNVRPSCVDCNGARGNGWLNHEAEVFPSCPLLEKLEKERPSLNIKLSFPNSPRWHDRWADRLEYRIKPHKVQRVAQKKWATVDED